MRNLTTIVTPRFLLGLFLFFLGTIVRIIYLIVFIIYLIDVFGLLG